jgi:hypothetical protein
MVPPEGQETKIFINNFIYLEVKRFIKAVPKMVPAQHKTPVFLGFLRLTGWKVVPEGATILSQNINQL